MSKYQTHKTSRDMLTKGELRKSRSATRTESAPIETVASQLGIRAVRPALRIVVR